MGTTTVYQAEPEQDGRGIAQLVYSPTSTLDPREAVRRRWTREE